MTDFIGGASRRGEVGYSLLEVLAATALVSLLSVGVLTGFGTTVRATSTNRTHAELVADGEQAAELMRLVPYRECATSESLTASLAAAEPALAARSTFRVTSIRYWTPASSSFAPAGSPCASDGGAQLVRYRVARGGRTLTAETIIRNPGARP